MEDRRDPQMTDREWRMFTQLLRLHCGLECGSETRPALEHRIARRVRELEIESFAAYHYFIRQASGAEELARLIEETISGESHFFRDRGQLDALVQQILAENLEERRADGGNPLSIWSAGCAGGEEPYSVVMLALESELVPGTDFKIFASDISRRMLARARRGSYRETSLRETEPALRQRYFHERGGLWQISDAVRENVDFIDLNFLDPGQLASIPSVDVVLCRDASARLTSDSRQRLIETFWDKLRPGGHLFLGRSESLVGVSTSFELRRLNDESVYRKPSPGLGLGTPRHGRAEAGLSGAAPKADR